MAMSVRASVAKSAVKAQAPKRQPVKVQALSQKAVAAAGVATIAAASIVAPVSRFSMESSGPEMWRKSQRRGLMQRTIATFAAAVYFVLRFLGGQGVQGGVGDHDGTCALIASSIRRTTLA